MSTLSIDPNTKRALAEVLRYEFMTVVQEQSCPVALTGVDVLAKAKTGTGKTIRYSQNVFSLIRRTPRLARAKPSGTIRTYTRTKRKNVFSLVRKLPGLARAKPSGIIPIYL